MASNRTNHVFIGFIILNLFIIILSTFSYAYTSSASISGYHDPLYVTRIIDANGGSVLQIAQSTIQIDSTAGFSGRSWILDADTDKLFLTTAGGDVLSIDGVTRNVGIGIDQSVRLHVSGDSIITGYENVGTDLTVGDTADIGTSLVVGSTANVGTDLTVGNNADIGQILIVGDSASIGNDLTVGNDADITATITANDASFADSLYAGGNAGIGVSGPNQKFEVNGAITIGPGAVSGVGEPGAIRWTGSQFQIYDTAWRPLLTSTTAGSSQLWIEDTSDNSISYSAGTVEIGDSPQLIDLDVTGNTDLSGTLGVGQKVTVATGGIEVTSGGLVVTAGGGVITGGLTVNNGATINNGGTINGGATVAGGLDVATGDSHVTTGNMYVNTGLLNVGNTGTFGNKLTVSSGGLQVVTGNLDVDSGNLDVSGTGTFGNTLTVTSGGLDVTGATVLNNGLTVTSGTLTDTLTVSSVSNLNGGVTILNDAVIDGGATITGGLTVDDLTINGDIAAVNGDFSGTLDVTGLSTLAGGAIINNGLDVTGVTTLAGTLDVTGLSTLGGGATINNGLGVTGGAVIADGLDVTSGGATISGDMTTDAFTINSGVLNVGSAANFANGIVITNGGLDVTGGIITDSLTTSSLTINGDLSAVNGVFSGDVTGVNGNFDGLNIGTWNVGSSGLSLTFGRGSTIFTVNDETNQIESAGGLQVTRASRLDGGATVNNGLTVDTLTVSGNSALNTLDVSGVTNLNGAANFNSGATVTGGLTTDSLTTSSLTINGDLNAVNGIFSGNLNAVDGVFSGDLNAVNGFFTGYITVNQGGSFKALTDFEQGLSIGQGELKIEQTGQDVMKLTASNKVEVSNDLVVNGKLTVLG